MNDEQLLRYSRHILLPQVDIAGQEKLTAAKVMIIGLGGLGSPVALYLAAAGIGELVLCDFDEVCVSNLQRQILHDSHAIGKSKIESAIFRLKALNPECKIRGFNEPISENILNSELPALDLVIDCSDNLASRLLINKSCVEHKKILVSGAAIRMEGQLAIFLNAGHGPCYQCMFPDTDAMEVSCSEAGVLSSTVGIIGSLQAQAALKLLLGIGKTIDGSLLLMDGMSSEWRNMKINKRSNCPICSESGVVW